jgi:hypothetical protein
MAARAKPSSATKKKKTARKKAGSRKKTDKKAARRKSERKKKAARRKSGRAGPARERVSEKPGKTARKALRARSPKTGTRLPELVGFIREDSEGDATVSIQIDRGEIQVGDAIHVLGLESDFYERIETLAVAGRNVPAARAGEVVSLRVSRRVRANDAVHLLSR